MSHILTIRYVVFSVFKNILQHNNTLRNSHAWAACGLLSGISIQVKFSEAMNWQTGKFKKQTLPHQLTCLYRNFDKFELWINGSKPRNTSK